MADDLLVGIGVDVAAFRRDRATILSEAQGLQRDIVNALRSTSILPDLGGEARTAGEQVIAGLRAGIAGGAGDLSRDISTALVPANLTGGLTRVTQGVRSALGELSRDFADEGGNSATAYLQNLERGLSGARTVLGGFSRDVSATLQGSQGILGDLTPQAERAGRQLVSGLRGAVLRDSESLRTAVSASLVPANITTAFRPLIAAADEASGEIVLTLGAAGAGGARALTAGLDAGLGAASTTVARFVGQTRTTLARADLLSGLARQGEAAGGLLVSGVVAAVGTGRGEIQRAVVAALVPTSLPTELRALTSAVATETARLVPILASTGTEAGRGLIAALSASLTSGAGTAIATFARSTGTAVTGTNLLGDLTPVGDKAGRQLSTGVQAALARESTALRTAITAAIVPTDIGAGLSRLSGTLTAALAQFPAAFQRTGTESGGALVAGITAQLTGGRQLLSGFAQETSRALTAALTIGDTSGTGERAGRVLAASVATGIQAEAGTVRTALAAALSPASLASDVGQLTDTVIAEAATLAPELARQGTKAGEAYIGAIEGVVGRGAASLKQLSTGATVGVVVDSAPIRAAANEQEKLLAATEATAAATRDVSAAMASINTRPLTDAEEVAQLLAEASARAATAVTESTRTAVTLYRQQGDAARQAAGEAANVGTVFQNAAKGEIGALGSVADQIRAHITLLQQYGGAVDATNARAVADWEKQAASVRDAARAVGIEGQELYQLDRAIQRTADSFRRQAAEARNAARSMAEQQAGPRANVTGVSGDLAAVARQATAAKAAVAGVTIAGRSLQQITGRLGPALIGVGFGLESLARGGDSAQAGLRTALRAVASFATFFGPEGFLVAGVAAGTAAILDIFSKTRDEVEETRKKFITEVRSMVEGANFEGLQGQLKKIDLGSITVDDNLQVKRVKGLRELKAEATALNEQMAALGGRKDLGAVQEFVRIKKAMDDLRPTVQQRIKDFNDVKRAIDALPTENTFKQPTIKITAGDPTKETKDALKALADQVKVVQEAFARVNGSATLQAAIIAKAIPLYDQIRKLAQAHKGEVSDATNDLAKMLRTLGDIDAVSIELTRRKLGGIAPENLDVPKAHVIGILDRIEMPKAAAKLEVPAEFDAAQLSDSLRSAIARVTSAQNQQLFAQIFGSKQQVAAATKTVDVLTQNLTRTFRAAVDAELASADSDAVKIQKLRGIGSAARDLNIDIANTTRGARDLGTTLSNVGDAAHAIAEVGRSIRGADSDLLDMVDSAGQLASALSDLSKLDFSGKDSIFSSFNKLLEGIPVIGKFITAAIGFGQTAFNAITGRETKRANDDILKENNAQLEKLRQDLKGFDGGLADMLGASRAIQQSAILSARAGTSGFGRGFRDVEGLDRELRAAGSSLALLKREADFLGITIVDAKGRVTAEGLAALDEASRLAAQALLTLQHNAEDMAFVDDARRQIFDQTDAASVAKDWLDELRSLAPAVAKQFFGGADTATKQGRAAFEQGIRDAFNAATAGRIPAEVLKMFGGIKPFIEFLLSADSALDSLADSAREAAGEMINVASGFAVQNRVFKAIMQGQGDQRSAAVPPTPKPVPLPTSNATTSTTGGASVSITVDVGGLTVGQPAQTKEQVYQAVRRQALDKANALGPTYRDAVEAALPA